MEWIRQTEGMKNDPDACFQPPCWRFSYVEADHKVYVSPPKNQTMTAWINVSI